MNTINGALGTCAMICVGCISVGALPTLPFVLGGLVIGGVVGAVSDIRGDDPKEFGEDLQDGILRAMKSGEHLPRLGQRPTLKLELRTDYDGRKVLELKNKL